MLDCETEIKSLKFTSSSKGFVALIVCFIIWKLPKSLATMNFVTINCIQLCTKQMIEHQKLSVAILIKISEQYG